MTDAQRAALGVTVRHALLQKEEKAIHEVAKFINAIRHDDRQSILRLEHELQNQREQLVKCMAQRKK
jgi:hypothetical protein